VHPSATDGFKRMLSDGMGHLPIPSEVRVLDVGGADVNGTVHGWVRRILRPSVCTFDVLDIADGPGVTMIGDASSAEFWSGLAESGSRYDLVISTETLEHVEGWRQIVDGASEVLRSGGWFAGTCASLGRRPHGARGEHWPPEGEHYGNVQPDGLIAVLLGAFSGDVVIEYSRRPGFPTTNDLYWRAER